MSTFGEIKSDQLQQYFFIPASTIFPFAGTVAPTGFLFCDGSQYGTAAYSGLFAAIGYTYGGSGGTFSVPDLRGRVPAGRDATNNVGGSAQTLTTLTGGGGQLGATGGSQTHQLTEAQMPTHTHGTSSISNGLADTAGSHNHGGTTTPNGGHNHGYFRTNSANYEYNLSSGASKYRVNYGEYFTGSDGVGDHNHTLTTSTHAGHQHPVTGNVVTLSAGGGTTHNNVQPTLILNYIIKV